MSKPASKRNKFLYCFISYLSAMIVFFYYRYNKKAYPNYFEGALNTGFVFTLLLRIILIVIVAIVAKEKEESKRKTSTLTLLLVALALTFLFSAINDSIVLKTTSDYAGLHKYSFEFKGLVIFINICEYLLFVLGIVSICLLKTKQI